MNERKPEQQKVKVTDRRRVRTEAEAPPSDPGRAEADGTESAGTALAEPTDEESPRSPVAARAGRPVAAGADPEGGSEKGEEAARNQAADYLEHLRRLQADFDNYRKRVLKEQTRAVEMASEPFVRRLLEVLDEFQLALMAAEQRPDFDKFLRGIELVYAKMQDVLRSEGVERIEAEGKPFDPEKHEALIQTGEGDGDPVVSDVLRQGYTMRGRVLRPAGVKVARA
jgi:molecular chaperone GrpE